METFKILLILVALLTSLACTVLLFRSYFSSRTGILLWTALCFVGLSVNCFALFVDVVVLPDADLRILRLSASLAGMLFLIFGFIRETD
jgi:hypothetical protein